MKLFVVLPLAIAISLFIGCQSNENKSEAYTDAADSTAPSPSGADAVKLVKTAGIAVKVVDVNKSVRNASAIARTYGGMLVYQSTDAAEQNRKQLPLANDSLLVISTALPTADIKAKIPSQHMEAFMFDMMDSGYLTSSSRLEVQNKTLEYLRNSLKQAARNDVAAKNGSANSKTSLQTIALRDEAIDQQINNQIIDEDVAYSSIDLHFFQNPVIRKEVIANTDMGYYQLSFWERMSQAASNGWHAFLNLILVITNLWAIFLLVAIGYVVYRLWFHRRSQAIH